MPEDRRLHLLQTTHNLRLVGILPRETDSAELLIEFVEHPHFLTQDETQDVVGFYYLIQVGFLFKGQGKVENLLLGEGGLAEEFDHLCGLLMKVNYG